MSNPVICGVDFDDFVISMEEFHGYRSPGILLGGLMIEASLDELGDTPYLNVATETVVCLPDAVQLLTPCTIGNGFLQTIDWGKFALTCYDRLSLSGVRVWLNPDALGGFPLVRQWLEKSSHKKEKLPFEALAAEILVAAKEVISQRPVHLHRSLKESQSVPTGRCPVCGESYPLHLGSACPACQDQAYYFYQDPTKQAIRD